MSSFLDFIKEKIPTIFSEESPSPFRSNKQYTDTDNKTLDDLNHEHELLINKIVNDIINFFMNDKDKDTYVLELLEPSVCNDLTLLLSKDLEDRFKSYAIDKFRNDITVSKNKHKPCTTRDSCTKQLKETIVSEDPHATKWDLCYTVASHYVKMLNVLAAILTGISPEKNMCIERMNSIYKVVDLPNGTQGFEINICRTAAKKAVKDRLFEENGLRELINLYILDHMDKINTDSDIKLMESEYKKLVKTLNNSGLLTKKITMPEQLIIESSSNSSLRTQSLKQKSPTHKTQSYPTISNSSSLLVDKIKSFQNTVNLTESKAKSVKLTPKLSEDLDYLKSASEKLSTLVSSKKVSGRNISSALSDYNSDYTSSSNISSKYESEVNTYSRENSNQPQQQQFVLYIGDAYNKLSEIKSTSSNGITYNTTSNTSTTYEGEEGEAGYNGEEDEEAREYETSEYNESEQAGGYDDKEDSLAKFNNFIKKYKEYWSPEIRKYFDELINNGFNTGAVVDVCNAAKVNNKDIFIDIADIYDVPTLTDFLDNFNDMKVDYIASCDKLIYILENDLLEQIKEKRSVKYAFRNLSTEELHALQKKCRTTLLEMYTKNHEYYLKGIGFLKRYFTSSFYNKAQTNKK
jgi:hypothetical protein